MTNTDQEEFWTNAAGPKWVTLQDEMDALMHPVLDLLLAHASLQSGARVLDIGCGTGASVIAAANAVGPNGHVTGLDISDTMLALAQERLAAHSNTDLLKADAQIHGFEDQFDAIISRFGVMFFEDSVAACANLYNALAPAGRMTFATWGPAPENPWFMEPAAAAKAVLGPMPKTDRALPGPFAFEDSTRVLDILQRAGVNEAKVETVNVSLTPSGSIKAASQLCTQIGPADGALRHHDANDEQRNQVTREIENRFAAFDGPQGFGIPAVIHIYSARKHP